MPKKFSIIGLLAVLTIVSAAVYWNTLDNEFINMDDLDLIVRNQYIKNLTWDNVKMIFTPGVVGAYQPLRTLSYAIDYHFWQLNPVGYHLTNITCHVLCTWLVFLLIHALRQPIRLAAVSALIFAVHPIHVEAVTWMSGRRDVLSALFVLLAVFGYVMFREISRPRELRYGWYLVALVACVLGLLSKPSAVVVPGLLILYDLCFGLPSDAASLRQRLFHIVRSVGYYLPFIVATISFFAVFISISRASGVARASYHGGSGLITFFTMIRVFAEYLYHLVFPTDLSLTYGIRIVATPLEASFLTAALVLTGVLVLTIIAWKRGLFAVVFGVAWWVVTLLPVSNILPIAVVKADRYLYLPSVGFCLVLAWMMNQVWIWLVAGGGARIGKRMVQGLYWLLIGTLLFSYGWLTIQRNRDWQNSETIWNATLETHPDSPIALNNLGLVYAEQGKYEQAINLYHYLLSKHPGQSKIERVYTNLGDAYAASGTVDEAIEAYQQALEANPEYVAAYLGLARVTTGSRNYEKAAQIYQLALELEPQNQNAAVHFARLRFIEGKFDEAIAIFQQILNQNPHNLEAYNGLGLCYVNTGQYEKAFLVYQQALAMDPGATGIRQSLGNVYMQQGELEKAIRQFQELLRIDPENVEVRNNLGMAYLRMGQPAEALRELMETVKRQPDDARIISNLGLAYAASGLPEQAIEMARWALDVNPDLFPAHVFLGDVCAGIGDVDCALKAYQKALDLQPNNQDVQEKLRAVQATLAQ